MRFRASGLSTLLSGAAFMAAGALFLLPVVPLVPANNARAWVRRDISSLIAESKCDVSMGLLSSRGNPGALMLYLVAWPLS
jgi:hypothetical protein